MKNFRKNRGITLISLVVTIIILLILAGVSISMLIGENGIIKQAQNAKEKTEEAEAQENGTLSQYETIIQQETGELWKQNKTIISKKDIALEVGDYVSYESNVEEYNDENGWRILGEENGQLLLVSTYLVNNEYTLSGAEDYLNNTGINKLNAECEKYGNGLYATGARSIKAEDIDRITGYSPEKTGNGKKYKQGEIDEYGNEVTYKIENGLITYHSKNGTGTIEDTTFTLPDGRVLGEDIEEVILKSNAYYYWPTTLIDSYDGDKIGLSDTSEAYYMLFRDYNNTSSNITYWLANTYVETRTTSCVWGMYGINMSKGNVGLYSTTNGSQTEDTYGIRAVIILDSDVKLIENGEHSWKLTK